MEEGFDTGAREPKSTNTQHQRASSLPSLKYLNRSQPHTPQRAAHRSQLINSGSEKKEKRREGEREGDREEGRTPLAPPAPAHTYFFTLASPLGILRNFFFLRIFTALRHSVSESSTSFTFP